MVCDAVQALGKVELCDGPDLIAVSAHKIHGPKGIGALWMRTGKEPAPFIHGGGQELGMRSGTLSPALCVGFGTAAKLADERQTKDYDHVQRLWTAAMHALGPDWIINGSTAHRYFGNLSIRRDRIDAARLLADLREIAFSLGSACASGSGRPSHVLRAIGLDYTPSAFIHTARLRALYNAAGHSCGVQANRRRGQGAGASRRVTLVRFFRADGTLDKEVEAKPGQRLLDVAWSAREPLEGACEGVMACSTCHVIVDAEDFAKLPAATEEEEDLLDLASDATRTSRLACQIMLTDDLARINVRIPGGATNWMKR